MFRGREVSAVTALSRASMARWGAQLVMVAVRLVPQGLVVVPQGLVVVPQGLVVVAMVGFGYPRPK